jgi:hypothetical protein
LQSRGDKCSPHDSQSQSRAWGCCTGLELQTPVSRLAIPFSGRCWRGPPVAPLSHCSLDGSSPSPRKVPFLCLFTKVPYCFLRSRRPDRSCSPGKGWLLSGLSMGLTLLWSHASSQAGKKQADSAEGIPSIGPHSQPLCGGVLSGLVVRRGFRPALAPARQAEREGRLGCGVAEFSCSSTLGG